MEGRGDPLTCSVCLGCKGAERLSIGGGGNRAPQNGGGGGVWEKGSIDRTINQLRGNLALKAPKIFWRIKNGQIFCPKYTASDDFSEPPRRTDSKNPIFILCRFLGLGHLRGPGVSLGRILGARQLSPFWGGFWHQALAIGSVSLWRLLASRP